MRENYAWYISPVLNPDGYEYTFSDVSLFLSHALSLDVLVTCLRFVVIKFHIDRST